MGKYTVELRELMLDSKTMEKLDAALSTYPLYEKKSKEEYIPSIVPTREELNKKLLNAYKYREIGFETPGRFLDELEIAMNEIMPYYNQLFFSADQDYNILFNVDYERITVTDKDGTVTTNETATSTGEASTDTSGSDITDTSITSNSNAKAVHSATPQNDLSITAANIDSVNYADDVNWSNSNGSDTTNTSGTTSSNSTTTNTSNDTSTSTGTNKEKEETNERTVGNFGVMATQDLISKYRDLIINIEQQIINDERISELFMRVF